MTFSPIKAPFVPKKFSFDLSARVAAEISRHPDGIAASTIHRALASDVSHRSLARTIKQLILSKQVIRVGATRALRYFPIRSSGLTSLTGFDPFRFKYRDELREAVAAVVRREIELTADSLKRTAAALVPVQARDRFVRLVLSLLRVLHEGNLAPYRLRLDEFKAWRESLPKV